MPYAKLKWEINFNTLHAEIAVQNTLESLKVNTTYCAQLKCVQSRGECGGCMT